MSFADPTSRVGQLPGPSSLSLWQDRIPENVSPAAVDTASYESQITEVLLPNASLCQGQLTVAMVSGPKTGGTSRLSARSRKGCDTCKKRKVKCNEEHPACGHCRRLHLTCIYPSRTEYQRSNHALRTLDSPAANIRSRQSRPWGPQHRSTGSSSSSGHATSTGLGATNGEVQEGNQGLHENENNVVPEYVSRTGDYVTELDQHSIVSTQQDVNFELLGEDSLWANLPVFSDFFPQRDSGGDLAALNDMVPHFSNCATPHPFLGQQLPARERDGTPPFHIQAGGHTQPAVQSPLAISDFSAAEIMLLRHFVDFAVPSLLVGIEPRWSSARDALLRVAKSTSFVRHAICAFAALSVAKNPINIPLFANVSSTEYYDLATKELLETLDSPPKVDTDPSFYENIFASIFFLCYVELTTSSIPRNSLDLLRRAHSIQKNKKMSWTALGNQLQVWLKLLDAKVVSAGGDGLYLSSADVHDSDGSTGRISQSDASDGEGGAEDPALALEDLLYSSLNRPAYNFYLQVLTFSGRIARLDKWHRSRGSVSDEFEVMIAADSIVRDLDALWKHRPPVIDYTEKSSQLRQHLSADLASKVVQNLRNYSANFWACYIHLQRVAYCRLPATPKVFTAVDRIVQIARLSAADEQAASGSMLWPLMMAACEVENEETRDWIIERIESMKSKVGNAMRTAKLVREIVRWQTSGVRADARTVMQETFGTIFAII